MEALFSNTVANVCNMEAPAEKREVSAIVKPKNFKEKQKTLLDKRTEYRGLADIGTCHLTPESLKLYQTAQGQFFAALPEKGNIRTQFNTAYDTWLTVITADNNLLGLLSNLIEKKTFTWGQVTPVHQARLKAPTIDKDLPQKTRQIAANICGLLQTKKMTLPLLNHLNAQLLKTLSQHKKSQFHLCKEVSELLTKQGKKTLKGRCKQLKKELNFLRQLPQTLQQTKDFAQQNQIKFPEACRDVLRLCSQKSDSFEKDLSTLISSYQRTLTTLQAKKSEAAPLKKKEDQCLANAIATMAVYALAEHNEQRIKALELKQEALSQIKPSTQTPGKAKTLTRQASVAQLVQTTTLASAVASAKSLRDSASSSDNSQKATLNDLCNALLQEDTFVNPDNVTQTSPKAPAFENNTSGSSQRSLVIGALALITLLGVGYWQRARISGVFSAIRSRLGNLKIWRTTG